MRIIFLTILLMLMFFSCTDDKETISPNLNYNYTQLEIGSYIIYNVTAIIYDDFTNTSDTSTFQVREVIDSNFTDLEGEEAFTVHRFERATDSAQWNLTHIWSSKITTTTFEKMEENNRFIKLTFPVRKNKKWNGNAMNNLGQNNYEYTAVHQSESIGGNLLDSVATVFQLNNINLIEENFSEEKYATNVGLAYQKNVSIKNKFNNATGLWERNSGSDITMVLSSYGK